MSTTKTTTTAKVETKAANKEKAVVGTVKAEAAKTEPAKTAAAKTAAKADEAKAAPKAAAKKTTKATTTKTAAAKKTTTAKKTVAAKKAPAKRAAKAEAEIYIEYAGSQQSTAEITARVVEATGKKASAIKVLNIYVQPETGKIYYTADGTNGEISY